MLRLPLLFIQFLIAFVWQACCSPVLAQTAPKTDETNQGMLWEVKSGKNVVHIFGAIHVAKPDFYPLPKNADDAFDAARVLVVEADISAPDLMAKIGNSVMYTPPDKLENHLSPAAWAKLKQQVGEASAALQGVKPGMLISALTMQYLSLHGYAADKGIDLHYLRRARAENKPIAELEGIAFQTALFANLSDADGEAWLLQVLQGMNDGELVKELDAMAQAWLAGDDKKLAQALRQSVEKDEISKKLMKVFFADRNPRLSKTIANLIKDGKQAFIVMGAGHCVGQNNVLELLQKQGFSVRRVTEAKAETKATATPAKKG